MSRNMFEERHIFKPFEYEEVDKYVDAINNTFWIHQEVAAELQLDVQDYHNKLSDLDRNIVSRILRTFADTETAILNDAWSIIGRYLKKPEFQIMGVTFAENEARHAKAYFRINEILDLTDFEPYTEDPILSGKFDNLLSHSLDIPNFDKDNIEHIKRFALGLAVFSCFTERVSLFSQFMILNSFSSNKRSLMKGLNNIIDWSIYDENIHSVAGIFLFNQIKKEYPEIWTNEFKSEIYTAASTVVDIETHVLNQIFEDGDLPNLQEKDVVNYMKYRTNTSLEMINLKPIFTIDNEAIKRTSWFEEGFTTLKQVDFLDSRSTDYTKSIIPFTGKTCQVSREDMGLFLKDSIKVN